MKSYPIWMIVDAPEYKGVKHYGARTDTGTDVRIGSSSSNSHTLVKHETTRRREGQYTVFEFKLDLQDGNGMQVMRTMIMDDDNNMLGCGHGSIGEWVRKRNQEIEDERTERDAVLTGDPA